MSNSLEVPRAVPGGKCLAVCLPHCILTTAPRRCSERVHFMHKEVKTERVHSHLFEVTQLANGRARGSEDESG